MGSARETIKRIRAAQLKKREGLKAHDGELAKVCPVLHDLMCEPVTESGKVLDCASLTVFTGDGGFKGCLNDRATHMQLWATGETFQSLLDALEVKLNDEEADWRPQPNWTAKKPKK